MSNKYNLSGKLLVAAAVFSLTGCTRDIDTDVLATYPVLSDVFNDEFASDLQYQAWGKVTNFSVDTDTKYDGTSSMKIEVPNPGDPMGSWAGGTFYSTTGRNLSDYDALTFYAKSSIPTKVEVGLGNYDKVEYLVEVQDVKLNTNWNKIIIPIPNPAKLLSEKGLFYYSAGAVDGEGYTIWFDEVRFERLGTLAHAKIEDIEIPGFQGRLNVGTLTEIINLPNGVNQKMLVSPNYFTFESSDASVASIANNVITIQKKGEAVISLKEAEGEIRVNCFDLAPVPQRNASEVLSLFSDSYTNKITANWNPRWEYSTAEYTEINTGDNHIAQYSGLNFVGIVFNAVADCSSKNYLHLDVLCMDEINANSELKIEIHDRNGNNVVYLVRRDTHADFESKQWLSLDIPLNENGKQIAQIVLACSEDIPNILLDNIYFY